MREEQFKMLQSFISLRLWPIRNRFSVDDPPGNTLWQMFAERKGDEEKQRELVEKYEDAFKEIFVSLLFNITCVKAGDTQLLGPFPQFTMSQDFFNWLMTELFEKQQSISYFSGINFLARTREYDWAKEQIGWWNDLFGEPVRVRID